MTLEYSDGDPWDNEIKDKRPKYSKPSTGFEIRVLKAVGRKYYPWPKDIYYDRYRRYKGIYSMISKAMLPLSGGIISTYPTEWVDHCIEWARQQRQKGILIGIKGLTTLILNVDAKEKFIRYFVKEHHIGVKGVDFPEENLTYD